MKTARRAPWVAVALALLAIVLFPALAIARPMSGGSFGSRSGFRSSGGGFSSGGYSNGGYGRSYGGGSNFVFLPSWGGYGGFGYGGGIGIFGTLVVMVVAGIAITSVMRAVRRGGSGYSGLTSWSSDDDVPQVVPGHAYLYRLQLAFGRTGRGVQERLATFASQGDTSSEAGLAALLQQTALELLRQKDSVRYVGADGRGPMSLTN